MNNLKFVKLQSNWKSLLITNESLTFTRKEFKSTEEMDGYLQSDEGQEDEGIETIEFSKILEFKYLQDGSFFSVKRVDYVKQDVTITSATSDVASLKDIETILLTQQFQQSEVQADKWIALKPQVFRLALAVVITSGLTWLASTWKMEEKLPFPEETKGRKNYCSFWSILWGQPAY